MDLGHRLDLKGWVVYPTRDETVAALSRYRPALAEFFNVSQATVQAAQPLEWGEPPDLVASVRHLEGVDIE